MKTLLASLPILLLFTACSTPREVLNGEGTGITREFKASTDVVWPVVVEVVANKLRVLKVDTEKHVILADNTWSFKSWGENVAVFVRPANQGTRVEVVSRMVSWDPFVDVSWQDPILNGVSARLGEPLPEASALAPAPTPIKSPRDSGR